MPFFIMIVYVPIRYVTVNDVIRLHNDQIKKYGGIPGIRDKGSLESAIYQPQATFAGQDLYPNIIEKAAAYVFYLCQSHAFVDGNKRTAAVTLEYFLELNGYELKAEESQFLSVIQNLANHQLGRADLANWLRSNIKKI